jgi:hypothetical protein
MAPRTRLAAVCFLPASVVLRDTLGGIRRRHPPDFQRPLWHLTCEGRDFRKSHFFQEERLTMTTATETPMRRRRDRAGDDLAMRTPERVVIPPDPATPDQIAGRAYELFEARGGQHGHDLEDWLTAERELTSLADQDR